MFYDTICSVCLEKADLQSRVAVDIRNESGLHCVECSRGHQYYVIFQGERFELLGSMGIEALYRASYREAVINFQTSLERFYEWGTKCMMLAQFNSVEDCFAAYKKVGKFSERQIGMFFASYIHSFAAAPALFQDNAGLRNNVMHNGYIPTKEEAETFCQSVINYIFYVMADINAKFLKEHIEITSYRIELAAKDVPDGGSKATATYYSPYLASGPNRSKPLDLAKDDHVWKERFLSR